MSDRAPGPSRMPSGSHRQAARVSGGSGQTGRAQGVSGQTGTVPQGWLDQLSSRHNASQRTNDTHSRLQDVIGYKITLLPQSKRDDYFVKFTPLNRSDLPPNPLPAFNQPEPTVEDGPDTVAEERYEVIAEPEDSRSEIPASDRSQSAVGHLTSGRKADDSLLGELVLETILGSLVEDSLPRAVESPPRTRRQRPRSLRNRSRARLFEHMFKGRRPNRRLDRSEPSMYEVVDVDYETITGLKAPANLDWRVSPRYELNQAETSRQEKELFHLMTSESMYEVPGPAKPGEVVCCVCHENAATRVVVPCGHRCLCRACALHIATTRSYLGSVKLAKKCPMCQAVIGLMTRII